MRYKGWLACFNRGTNRVTICENLWMNWDCLTLRKEFGGIGFLHLYGFNLAMLGKEGRRLLTNQDNIASRVFKARYFRRWDFLGASLDHNPSYDCRSIYTSQVVAKGSLRWWVGNGQKINVWRDAWLGSMGIPYVSSPMVNGMENLRVCDIVEHKSNQ